MKRILLLILILITQKILPIDKCSPTLYEIFNFEVGDKFTYLITDRYSLDDPSMVKHNTFNIEIINKFIRGDTLMYILKGGYPLTLVTKPDFDRFDYVETDTLILIDSTNHLLNLCDSALVYFDALGHDSFCSYLSITDSDGLYFKSIGGLNNLYHYYDTNLIFENAIILEEKYSPGIGLYSQYLVDFEWDRTLNLASYIKSGDTTVLMSSIVDFDIKNEITIFPNPASNIISIKPNSSIEITNLKIYNSLGREIINISDFFNDQNINISNFKNGIYFIVINSDNKFIAYKFIKN